MSVTSASKRSTRVAAGDRSRLKILLAIATRKHYPFTVRELADKTGLSSSATHHHLVRLRDDGMVGWTDGAKRTLGLTKRGAAHLTHLSDLRKKRGKGDA